MTTTRLPKAPVAPALTGATGWLNTAPLTPKDLHGHVVLYVFWTYTCINWLRVLPYVRAWEAKYRDQGLVVVGIHTPEFTFEQDIDNVRPAVLSHDIEFPVVLDSEYAIWRRFDNHYWPALYLADGRGVIRYQHFGEGRYADTEQAIQQLSVEAGLLEAGLVGAGLAESAVAADLVVANGTGDEAPADWDELGSAETYLGYDRTEGFASVGGLGRNVPRTYDEPPRLLRNTWALSGEWTAYRDRIVAIGPAASIVTRFHARDLHLVMTPADRGGPVRFRVSIDGGAPGDAHGLDINPAGEGIIEEPRMYQLIRQERPIIDHTAEISFPDGGAAAFVITFG
jgi:thiol-disulfide isomerase/thioredoxin